MLLLVVAILGLAVALWWRTRPAIPAAGPAAEPGAPIEPTAVLENPEATRSDSPLADAGPRPPAPYPVELDDPSRFVGRGRIEVHLELPAGVSPPERWVLALQPSVSRIGGDRARARTIDVVGRPAVVVDDVQLGAYSARAIVGELECAPYEFELRKPDEVDVVFSLALHERGFLTGRVIDARGTPVEGLAVYAIPFVGSARREARTDAKGVYLFPSLPDGDYRVRVGTPEQPLASVEDLSFSAPSAHLRDLVTPLLGTVRVRVVDELGNPVAGAKVQGLGLASGAFEVLTGPDGRATAGPCVGGDLSLYATDALAGHGDAKLHFHPDDGGVSEIELRLRP